jgi:metal-dependent amidase/aminoacylase/carboxypeptidase family protein
MQRARSALSRAAIIRAFWISTHSSRASGGHGATPHKTVDPIVCSCAMILHLQTLISRESPSYEPAVLTVGSIHAGTRHNIIPDDAVFSGTIRTFSDAHQNFLRQRVAETGRSCRQIVQRGAGPFPSQSHILPVITTKILRTGPSAS